MVNRKQRLKRLPAECYLGHAWVHWTFAIQDRKEGWLDARFLYKFRELLTHVAFRDQIACPIFCLMPDHMHLLWCGLAESSDQILAAKHLRSDLNDCFRRIGYQLQTQAYDHVLKDDELELGAIEAVAEYIARNPERKKLVGVDQFAKYPYTNCLLPGYPQLRLFQADSWNRVWRTLSFLKRTNCHRFPDPKYANRS
ncbi:hypothetical protein K227x_12880 [Rubripirellula lacrimiformis]|uniref:Transposase IS200-like domain-containing protein n=2 Tax=Rubripirellula lacrimiformis TaxID=1930273 RepID=A0A517N6Y2_9BACT|nr:hypothetical protein K227x_12880 [Rubripirellula lacrimiformis]